MSYTCVWERLSGLKLRELTPDERERVVVRGPRSGGTLDFRQAVRLCREIGGP